MIFLEYPKCSTCKKAKNFLIQNNISYDDRDIVINNPTKEELIKWTQSKGINKFFNTSGIKYRNLNLKEKLKFMSDEEKIELLSSDGMIIKRPLLIKDNNILIGFKEDIWKNELL